MNEPTAELLILAQTFLVVSAILQTNTEQYRLIIATMLSVRHISATLTMTLVLVIVVNLTMSVQVFMITALEITAL